MSITTIKLQNVTKSRLENFREYKNETYDEILNKIAFIAENVKDKPKLSQETIKEIEAAKKRYQKGLYVTEKQAAKILGIKDI